MTREPVFACTLGGADLPQRMADYRALGRDALLSVDRGTRHAVLRFRRDAAVREQVDAVVDAESSCCAFLDYGVEEQTDAIVLTLTAPEGGEEMMLALADALADA
jgi:hypothetical protein